MKRCLQKKGLIKKVKCLKKDFKVFLISFFYSSIFYKLFRKGNKKGAKVVFVGLSGGVDSSVSALILKKAGYRVVGVFMKVYQPEVATFCWRNELLDAKRVAKELDIPFLFFNLEKEYKRDIFDYMIDGYKKGQTPNPDVFCNKFIKFGAFLKKALELEAEKVAMGHYARVEFDQREKKYFLKKGLDSKKDQSYFLSAISQEQLSKAIFPIGDFQKGAVREMAKEAGLLTANKKDSQGLCFVGKVDMKDFLENFLRKKEGAVLNEEGRVIGKHKGVIFYTIGTRHGFEIFPEFKKPNMERLFILSKDLEKNTLTVGPKNEKNIEEFLDKKEILVRDLN
jgi:tRNA-specific 2-thiouridylase